MMTQTRLAECTNSVIQITQVLKGEGKSTQTGIITPLLATRPASLNCFCLPSLHFFPFLPITFSTICIHILIIPFPFITSSEASPRLQFAMQTGCDDDDDCCCCCCCCRCYHHCYSNLLKPNCLPRAHHFYFPQ